MAYEFKKLSDVAAVETPAATANVLIEEDGVIKKVAKEKVAPAVEALPLPETATVGQMFKVSEVDENGKVTKVEAVDMPSGDGVARAAFCGDVDALNLVSGDYESVKQAIINHAPVDVTLYSYDSAGQLHLHHFDILYVADNEDAIYVGEGFYWSASNPTKLVSFD